MKNQNEIKKAFAVIKPKSNILPILECVCVMNNQLMMTDLNTSIIFKEIGIVSDFVQNAKEFINTIGFISNPQFLVESGGKKITISDDSESFTYGCDDVGNFPKIKTESIAIGILTLKDLKSIKRAIATVSTDDLRPAMNHICIKDGYVMGTDAHCAIYSKSDLQYSREILIGKKSANLLQMFKTEFNISVGENYLVFENDEIIITQRIDDSKYPNLMAVIPTEYKTDVVINKNDLLQALKKAQTCSSQITKTVIFDFDDRLTITAEDIHNDRMYKRQISCNKTGEKIRIGFNCNLALRMINSISDAEITFKLTAKNQSATLNDSALLMPVMINHEI